MANRSTADGLNGLAFPVASAFVCFAISCWSVLVGTHTETASLSTPRLPTESRVATDLSARSGSPNPGASTASITGIRDANGDARLRVLLVGDSLMWGAVTDITTSLATHGIEVEHRGGPGTGLLTSQPRWVDEIAESVATFAPDVVVIEACCNYYADHTLLDGSTLAPDSELMYELWRTEARVAIERAQAGAPLSTS